MVKLREKDSVAETPEHKKPNKSSGCTDDWGGFYL